LKTADMVELFGEWQAASQQTVPLALSQHTC